MPALDIHHVAIKTHDVDATVAFYNDVIGSHSVSRPDFDFPGAWLQLGETMFHIYGGWAAKNTDGEFDRGGAAVDHIALAAQDFDGMKRRIEKAGLAWRQNAVPDAGLWQLFVRDPNGVMIELNFPIDKESRDAAGPDGTQAYKPGTF